jgi:hypothetical protein
MNFRFGILSFLVILPTTVAAAKGNHVSDSTHSAIALKTNLLYDAALSPSIEAEYRFAPHWSVNAEYSVAWWSNKPKHQYYQQMQLSPEIRFWFYQDKLWKGHYLGALAGAGYYDRENGADGYKGEFIMTGLSYGYMFPM